MLSGALEIIFATLQAFGVGGANAALIEKIIAFLVGAVPVIVQEAKDLKPMVTNIIVALKNDPATTAEQLAQLDAQEAILDADFDSVAAAALAAKLKFEASKS